MVEAVDTTVAELEGADEPPEVGRALDERHPGACLRKAKSSGQPEDPPADDAHSGAGHASALLRATRSRTAIRQ